MEFIEKVRNLYADGRIEEAMNAISSKYPLIDEMPVDVLEVEAWCLFRFKKYELAAKASLVLAEQGSQKGYELLAQIAGYVNKDDELLEKIFQKLPINVNVCNAYAIRARDPDSRIRVRKVLLSAISYMNEEEISVAHLLNNTARLLMAKGYEGTNMDIVTAIGFWQIALSKYGSKNYHHRAAVYYWLSKAYEKLGMLNEAEENAKKSLNLWEEQVALDKNNPKFQENLEGAKRRFEELQKLSTSNK
ncbi:MAG TPA: hypothetical protein PLD14_02435 [Candidatus Pacearchaeota archaeon]|nr:hypothetical protein [Candidatus Pacearchaeota archaeon]HPR80059.1 hypothetical protein [Candidatus Pacearchaeota archaeon]